MKQFDAGKPGKNKEVSYETKQEQAEEGSKGGVRENGTQKRIQWNKITSSTVRQYYFHRFRFLLYYNSRSPRKQFVFLSVQNIVLLKKNSKTCYHPSF